MEPHVAAELERRLERGSDGPAWQASDTALTAVGATCVALANHVVPGVGAVLGVVAMAELAGLKRRTEARERCRGAPSPTPAPHVERAVDRACAARHLDGAPAWDAWLPWNDLRAGAKVPVPEYLGHPATAGFHRTRLASHVGQDEDMGHPLADGSRLHAWGFHVAEPPGAEGMNAGRRMRWVVHRDALDPERGDGIALVHWIGETPEGRALGAAVLVGAVALLGVWVAS